MCRQVDAVEVEDSSIDGGVVEGRGYVETERFNRPNEFSPDWGTFKVFHLC